MKLNNLSRIAIIGNSGSGKSYLAKKLFDITGLPLTHLDNVFWKPNWEKTPKEEWIRLQEAMVAKDRWIIDGNYNSTAELRFKAAELVVFLDSNRVVCLIAALIPISIINAMP